ncbi:MAG: endonuclease/exonuclease/phosphatase family protein [Acidimicrobiia bacterium]|nr:endonuclease/exonuclease/phosphatase family protein [Acidimicrobiia bacterium]
MSLAIATWNVEWATPRSQRAPHLLNRIDGHAPDVICLTETHHDLLSQGGHSICSQADYGYPIHKGRRKVLLWSSQPWQQVDDLGIDSFPPGRFVSGVTQTPLGDVSVVGVWIPWSMSRTEARRGDARKKPWEDHERYLDGLCQVLARVTSERVIVIGDFNQMIGPASRAPAELRLALHAALPPGMRIVTSDIAFKGRATVDHIALSPDLAVESVSAISNLREGKKLSDHFGVAARVTTRSTR